MTIEEKKEYLKSYLLYTKAAKRIEEEIEQLRLNKMFPSAIIDDMPHGSSQKDMSDYMAKLDELEQKLIKARYDKITLYTKIFEDIEKVENETEREVLTYRYIRGHSWEQICTELGYSWKHTHRIHSNALQHFNIN